MTASGRFGHRVELEAHPTRVRVRLDGSVIADSTRALRVLETRHAPVFYLPREDVRMDRLERTDHATTCPLKGEAAYWTVRVDGRTLENAAWSYEDPLETVRGLKDHVAFYTDRLELVDEGA